MTLLRLEAIMLSEQAAIVAMNKIIDSKKLYIVLAKVQLAENSNVRQWEAVR